MDDFSIVDDRLTSALENLRQANKWLGGHQAALSVLRPFLLRQGQPVRILDLATGIADFPEVLARWADKHERQLEIVAIDANAATVSYARETLEKRLPENLRQCIVVEEGDALHLDYEDGSFDIVVSSLFMHHLNKEEARSLLCEMTRVASEGIIVNDLHRHPMAYYSIVALSRLLPVSPMFRNDGPLSVRKGFTRRELHDIAVASQLETFYIRWHWAFRWTLSTV